MADVGLAAFSLFFMQSSSFLAYQRQLQHGHGRSNAQSLFGMTQIACDNHIRDLLDPVAPACLHPVFAAVLSELDRDERLDRFRCLGRHVLIALDGTEAPRHRGTEAPRHRGTEAPSISVPKPSTASVVRRGCAAMGRANPSMVSAT